MHRAVLRLAWALRAQRVVLRLAWALRAFLHCGRAFGARDGRRPSGAGAPTRHRSLTRVYKSPASSTDARRRTGSRVPFSRGGVLTSVVVICTLGSNTSIGACRLVSVWVDPFGYRLHEPAGYARRSTSLSGTPAGALRSCMQRGSRCFSAHDGRRLDGAGTPTRHRTITMVHKSSAASTGIRRRTGPLRGSTSRPRHLRVLAGATVHVFH